MLTEHTYKNDQSTGEKALPVIVRAAGIFKRAHCGVFRNYDLSFPQYNFLKVLEASNNGERKISDVNRIMLLAGANMTGLAKRLEKNGTVFRSSLDRIADPKSNKVAS